jgi:hypothetical protein
MSVVTGLVVIVIILAITGTVWLIIGKTSHGGAIIVEPDEDSGKLIFRIELDRDPYEIANMGSVTFKVVDNRKFAE